MQTLAILRLVWDSYKHNTFPQFCNSFSQHWKFLFELFLFATGWDTDQFLTDIGEATLVMLSVVRNVCDKCVSSIFITRVKLL